MLTTTNFILCGDLNLNTCRSDLSYCHIWRSVADPGCLSRIPDPDFFDPGSKNRNKREGWKKFVVIPFFVATNFTKFEIIIFLKCWKKKLSQFSTNYRFFTQKSVTMLSKIWVWDPGSKRGQKDMGSRIPDPDPQHWSGGSEPVSIPSKC